MAAACWPDRTLQATIMCGLRPKKKKIETEKEKKKNGLSSTEILHTV